MAFAGANVVDMEPRYAQLSQSKYVRFRDVHDVDVVAQARAVGSRIICSIDFKMPAPSRSRLQQQRNDVGFGVVAFPPILTASTGVKVTERYNAPPVGARIPTQNSLEGQFALTIRVDR